MDTAPDYSSAGPGFELQPSQTKLINLILVLFLPRLALSVRYNIRARQGSVQHKDTVTEWDIESMNKIFAKQKPINRLFQFWGAVLLCI